VRMYKTGDLGRLLPDGTLEFIGRRDNQVKIRGYRIELGEIESALLRYPEMEAVVVNAYEEPSREKVLVAYLVNKQSLNAETLRSYLGDKLPPYMIPSCFMQLDELPLNANGKVDRKQLPAPGKDSLSNGVAYVAPKNETEEALADIWQDILGKEQVGIKDNFFEAGGHSLKVTRLSSQIHKRFNVKLALKELFTRPVLEEQAMLIRQAQRTSFTAIPVAPEQRCYELSSSQRRLWVLSQFENGNIAYNMPGAFIFEGELDSYALASSFEWLIARHEILRTVFREDEQGNVKQFILSPEKVPFHITTVDLRKKGKINELMQQDFTQPFDLAAGPLLRASLYRVADNKWILTYVMHHIISDGWSMNVLMKELLMLYNTSTGNGENILLPLRIQYKDYATWQQQQGGELVREHKEYWLKQFAGWLPVLELPADKPRPAIQTYKGGLVQRKISASASAGLKALTRQQDSTLFMGLLAAVNVLLYRYTGQDDIIIGSPIAGREHADLEDQIGLYLNTLALRTSFDGNDSYYKLLENVKQVALEAYEHQLYPFDDLVDELKLRRDMSRNALFDVMVTLHNTRTHDTNAQRLHGLSIAKYEWSSTPISKFDLSFDFVEAGEEIQVSIEYNSDLFEKETVSRMAGHLEQLLQTIIADPSMPLCRFDYVSDGEKEQLLETFNDTTVLYNKDRLVIDLFEEQVERTPDHTALVFGETALCYRDLNERANKLANYLGANYALMPNQLAGIKLVRSEWMIIATLAVLKTGAAYVPVDPGYPQDRIDYMLTDSNCRLVVDEELLRHFMQTVEEYDNTNPVRTAQPDDLVYVIYTSGSTGRPKGVMVANKHVVNIAEGWRRSYGLDSICVNLLQMASHSFDVFMGDVCRSLLTGGKMVICPNDVKLDPESLYSMMERHGISILESPPGVLLPLMDYILDNKKPLDFMKLLIFGSDTLNVTAYKKLVDRVGGQLRIINSYGATEAAIDSSYYEAGPGTVIRAYHSTPIGKPFPNSSFYILNEEDQLQPIGVAGEICIGGAGVAKGYLNREELTAAKFTDNPFRARERMYRTGDLGRWLPDGNVEFLGRKDDQVKIHGYRVELGEIESALLLHPEVEAAVAAVQAGSGGEKDLVAYLVIRNELNVSDIRSYLGRNLPAYMIPNYYVQLGELPLTPNGKIDRKRLPSHRGLGMSASVEYVAPRTETERQLVLIWEEVLDRKEIGVKDNFFELGGHSLKLMRVLARISEQFDVKISIETFFKDPYIEVLSKYIDAFLTLQEEAIPETTDELIF
ncbi:MAG TPA: amino acid adenylation domain-containing protein, partial [Chitinophaga sp.]|nr:amino acid adenylation domain-containing protein [Chitinophaga sp.]